MKVEAKEMTSVDLQRRLVLKATGAAAGCCALSAGTAQAQSASGPTKGDLLVPAKGDATAPLKASDIKVGSKPVLVYPYDLKEKKAKDDSRLNKLLLVRLDPSEMTAEIKARAANGVVAYSAVCTHQGCDVTEFVSAEKVLMCFCHFSKFSPVDGTVTKGPASKPLVYVPLVETDGLLTVAGGFSNKPGV